MQYIRFLLGSRSTLAFHLVSSPITRTRTHDMSAQSPYTAFQGAQFHKLVWEAPGVLRVSLNRPPVNAWHDPYVGTV